MCPTGLQALKSHAPQFYTIYTVQKVMERCNVPVRRIGFKLLGKGQKVLRWTLIFSPLVHSEPR